MPPKRKVREAGLEYLPENVNTETVKNHGKESADTENILPKLGALTKSNYNGTGMVHVVMLRVMGEASSRPIPQAAFFSREKAIAFTLRIFTAWCDSHYLDYSWRGPDELSRHYISRYTAFDSQTGQKLVTADAVTVSIFDAKDEDTLVNQAANTVMSQTNERETPAPIAGEFQVGEPKTATKTVNYALDLSMGSGTETNGGWSNEVDKKVMKGDNSS